MGEGNIFSLFVSPNLGGGKRYPSSRFFLGVWSQVLSGGILVPGPFPGPWSQILSRGTPVPGSFLGIWSQILSEGYPRPGWGHLLSCVPQPGLGYPLGLRYTWPGLVYPSTSTGVPLPGLWYPAWPGLGYPPTPGQVTRPVVCLMRFPVGGPSCFL